LLKHILFAQMCEKDKTQVKQTYEVFSYVQEVTLPRCLPDLTVYTSNTAVVVL